MSKATAAITDQFKGTFVKTRGIDTTELQRALFQMGFYFAEASPSQKRTVFRPDAWTYLRVDCYGAIWRSEHMEDPSSVVDDYREVSAFRIFDAAEQVRKIKREESKASKKRRAQRKWEATSVKRTHEGCPVAPDVIVAYKLNDGYMATRRAGELDWTSTFSRIGSDIKSYKVIGYPKKKCSGSVVSVEQMFGDIAADLGMEVLKVDSVGNSYISAGRIEAAQLDKADTNPKDEGRTNPKDALGDKKVPLWLLSPIAKAKWAVCQYVGLAKYGAWNWREMGVRSSVYLSAMQRHMDAYLSGEEVDPVDGTEHLGHIMACCAILIDANAAGKLTDDRPPSVGIREAYAEVESQMVRAKENYGHMSPRHYTIADTK